MKLPSDKSAPIAVLGAGPSGLLFSHRLQQLGHTNVTIYESTNRHGGKTHTVTLDAPAPDGSHKSTACELGTCYLSPAYDDMVDALAPYFRSNVREGFRISASGDDRKDASFRGMVTEHQFDGVSVDTSVMSYNEYVLKRGYYEANKPFANPDKWLDEFDPTAMHYRLLGALTVYAFLVERYLGSNMPMPTEPPKALLEADYKSFYDFLERNDLLVLSGVLEYAYSVQGYGPLKEIPAYYGMIWISVPLVLKLLLDELQAKLGWPAKPGVSVLQRGWLAVWDRMAEELTIVTNVEATKIERHTAKS